MMSRLMDTVNYKLTGKEFPGKPQRIISSLENVSCETTHFENRIDITIEATFRTSMICEQAEIEQSVDIFKRNLNNEVYGDLRGGLLKLSVLLRQRDLEDAEILVEEMLDETISV